MDIYVNLCQIFFYVNSFGRLVDSSKIFSGFKRNEVYLIKKVLFKRLENSHTNTVDIGIGKYIEKF